MPEPGSGDVPDKIVLNQLGLLSELTHATRSQVIRALKLPRTVAELATALNVPVTRLYHHVNRLESLGFIRVVATRRVGAVTERRYQVAAKSWQVDHDLFQTGDRRELAIALGGLFDVSKMAFQREVEAGGLDHPDDLRDHGFVARRLAYLTDDDRREFMARLVGLVESFESDIDQDAPGVSRMELFVAAFPETS